MSTPDEAHTWEELIDQLAPPHIEVLRMIESGLRAQGNLSSEEIRVELLRRARELTPFTTGNMVMGDIPFPFDAGRVSAWKFEADRWQRDFEGAEQKVENISLQTCGVQFDDGSVIRRLCISGVDKLDVNTARQLAAAISSAAQEMEHLDDTDA